MPVQGNVPGVSPAAVPPAAAASSADESQVLRSALRKASLRLLPVISIGYGLAYMDRINISFASLRMNADLHFSATVYGLGAGLFFVAYAICEVPSNLLMLRFGARKWMTRIMLTWGLLATAMMLVRTPLEFYSVRLLLGVAEAGFFPGVIYYLTLWFPANMRARAVSRFYIAFPLSSTVMGALAGWLMGLNGRLHLAGWQWLFLVEGLPAVLFSLVIWWALPDGPAQAAWLTGAERASLCRQLNKDASLAHLGHHAGVLPALISAKVWLIGAFFFCALLCSYAYGFSAPAIYQEATGWSIASVGYLVAGLGLAGALAMLLNSAHSDRTSERPLHCIVPCLIMAVGYVTASFAREPWLVLAALGASFLAFSSLLGPALAMPMQFLAGPAAAAGVAAMNTITMFSGFVGPVWMGRMKDLTGNYQAGLRGLVLPSLAAAGIMYALTRSLARPRLPSSEPVLLAEESA
jgi:ACS family tartrate transporter-like MFS transporter